MSKISFTNSNPVFYKRLKEKVNSYFDQNKISPKGGTQLLLKSTIITFSAVVIYIVLVFFTPGALVSAFLCALFGCNLAIIGFNIMHEGGHGSFSKHKWLNDISAYSLNALGGTIYFWKQRHNIEHHTYTNIEGLDHDIDIKFMRMHAEQRKRKYHKFQHLYWVLLYGISYIVWILYQDFEKYFRIKNDPAAKKLTRKEHLIFWATKFLYLTVYLIIPCIMVGVVNAFTGFLIAAIICGFCISMVFQLAHVVEGTNFPEPDIASNKIAREWAIHQVSTTANFATKSRLVSWFLGGLNFQVEHHLFPGISHIHYPYINRIIKETCTEFNITYLEHKTIARAFMSHLVHLRKLGLY
ncbi:fatty acid desaturase family protein [Paradesertivirga mongoliensis]|uniref:Fatty acid desaturase family protein n=1 Tax=Paradesertivirga mongoliensis TaxID=2100740 RepID=A0ABW4ZJX1_9SPHI|nr:acyl-CoA desaturase [Pedobacter mongoliensis]